MTDNAPQTLWVVVDKDGVNYVQRAWSTRTRATGEAELADAYAKARAPHRVVAYIPRPSVPREPTEAMMAAAALYTIHGQEFSLSEVWRAMYDAAPREPHHGPECMICHGTGRLDARLVKAAQEACERMDANPDTRTEEQIIADGVAFVMGPDAAPHRVVAYIPLPSVPPVPSEEE